MIHLRMTGVGPPVLLLHGTPSTADEFRPLVERLAKRHRFLWPDLPGYGLTPQVEGKTSVARVQTVLEDALLAIGVHELAIVGFSFGAYRGLSIAVGGRLKVTDLVMLGGFARVEEQDRAFMKGSAEQLRKMPDFKDEGFRKFFAERMLSPAAVKERADWVEQVQKWLDLTTPAALADELESLAEARDLLPVVGPLKTRVTLRVGALDAATPPRLSEELHKRLKGSVLQLVPGAGHALLPEDAHRTLEAIDDALRAQVAPHRDHERE